MSYPVADTESNEPVVTSGGSQFDIKKFIYKLIGFLPWIILSVLIAYGISRAYLRYTPEVHRVSANLLIKDPEESSPENNILRELGVNPGGKEVQNQIDILQSYELAEAVVDSLNLQINIYSQGRIASSLMYGKTAPVFVHIVRTDSTEFYPDNFLLYVLKDSFELVQGTKKSAYSFTDTFLLSGKRVYFEKNSNIRPDENVYQLSIRDSKSVALGISSSVTVTKLHEMSGILEIAMLDQTPQRAVDIINKLIEVFNIVSINDKKVGGNKTSDFLDERVYAVEAELDQLESEAENYKRVNKFNDVSDLGGRYLEKALGYDQAQVEQKAQLELLESLQTFIESSRSFTDIIPSEYGISEGTLGGLIGQYNSAVLEYQEQSKISTVKDPVMGRLKNQLIEIKGNILKNIESIKESYLIRIRQAGGKGAEYDKLFEGFPEKEREYLKLKRQIGVKEQLYLFLLQKKEETELSLVSTINNTRVVEAAFDKGVVLPKSDQVMMFAVLIGLIVPIVIMLLLDFFNNKIEDRKQIEDATKVPIIGELTYNRGVKDRIIHNKKRSSLAEQFRLIVTNLQYLAPEQKTKVIMVTSCMSGEGKSFASTNLSVALSVGKLKVLLIEMDLHKPKFSKYLGTKPAHGLTDYLVNGIPLPEVITHIAEAENVDIITCGPVPPNPNELLLHHGLQELFNYARERYEFIVIDTSPVGLVADAYLINKVTDITLFIVRHKYSFKTTLRFIDRLYSEEKMKRLNIVVNGIREQKGVGYGYSYGYSYGYGYDYTQGSRYYPEDEKPKKWRKFFPYLRKK